MVECSTTADAARQGLVGGMKALACCEFGISGIIRQHHRQELFLSPSLVLAFPPGENALRFCCRSPV